MSVDLVQILIGAGGGGVVAFVLKGRRAAISEVIESKEFTKAVGEAVTAGCVQLLESGRFRDVVDARADHKIRNMEMAFGERLNAVQRDISRLETAQRDGQRQVLDEIRRVFARLDKIGEQTANVRGRLASHTDDDETEFTP